jgi:hypothetical protein
MSTDTGGGDDSWGGGGGGAKGWGFGGNKKKPGKAANATANTTAQPSAFGGAGASTLGSSSWGFSFGDSQGAGATNPVESQTTPAHEFSSDNLFDDFGASTGPDLGFGLGVGGGGNTSRGPSPKPPAGEFVDEPLTAHTPPTVETGEGAAKEGGEDAAEVTSRRGSEFSATSAQSFLSTG